MTCGIFKQVFVDHLVKGSTRVYWEIRPDFFDPGPYSFQLQHSYSGIPQADDWTNVGLPAVNATVLIDDATRETGKVQLSHFRVVLTTPNGVYYSAPANVHSALSVMDWAMAREIIRKERLRNKKAARPCVLIKRRRYGTPCTRCLNQLTDEVQDSDCPVCLGTGIVLGYHVPFPCFYIAFEPETVSETQDLQKGSSRDDVMTGRSLGLPMLHRYDVLVDATSDDRWLVDRVKIATAIRGFPVVLQSDFRSVPMTHVAYQLALNTPCQVENVTLEVPPDVNTPVPDTTHGADPDWLV